MMVVGGFQSVASMGVFTACSFLKLVLTGNAEFKMMQKLKCKFVVEP